MTIKMYGVESSNIGHVGYSCGNLYVLFLNNGLYKYEAVPEEIFKGLLEAESVGKYLNKEIKKNYECVKIFDDEKLYTDIIKSATDEVLEGMK